MLLVKVLRKRKKKKKIEENLEKEYEFEIAKIRAFVVYLKLLF